MQHILVVDDDPEIVELISIYLYNEGYQVARASDGGQALEKIRKADIDLMVLDIMMPGTDGMEVLRKLREKHMLPVIMLSAKTEDMDKIMGLMTGADDYMIKPFNPLELTARIKSLLRRSYGYKAQGTPDDNELIQLDGLEIDKKAHRVTCKGSPVTLTVKEFDILYLLARNKGRVFPAEEIFKRVWKENYFSSNNTVMAHISNLREKLESALGYHLIQTVWGVGYKIEE